MISFTTLLFCIQLKARMLQFEGEVSYIGSNDSFLHVLRCVKTKCFVVWMVGRTMWTLTRQTNVNSANKNLKTRNVRRNNLIKSPWTRNVGIDWLLLFFLYHKNHQAHSWYIAEVFCNLNVSPFHEDYEFGHHHFPLVNCWMGMRAMDGYVPRMLSEKSSSPMNKPYDLPRYDDHLRIKDYQIQLTWSCHMTHLCLKAYIYIYIHTYVHIILRFFLPPPKPFVL